MEPEVLRIMHRLEKEDAEDRAAIGGPNERPHEDRYFTLHPDTAELIHIMVQSAGCNRLVEVGVSHGYSTLWLAHAARLTGGTVTSLEINPKNIEFARRNLADAGLSDAVDLVLGDARDTLSTLSGPIDFFLLDSWEDVYLECLELIVPLLRPGGLLVADNVTAGTARTDAFVQALHDHQDIETINVPIGRNIQVSAKRLKTTR